MFLLRVIQSLEEHGVRCAVAGGHAVALLGAPRGTLDVDLVIPLTEKDFTKAEQALHGIGLTSRLPVTAKEVFHFRVEYLERRNLIAWSFVNPERPSEMVDILLSEDLKFIRTETRSHGRYRIRLVGLEDMIRMKKKSDRPQDREDVRALQELRKLRRRKK